MDSLLKSFVVKVILQRKSQLYVRHLQTSQTPKTSWPQQHTPDRQTQYKPSYQTFVKMHWCIHQCISAFTCAPGHVTPQDHIFASQTLHKFTHRTCETIRYVASVVLRKYLVSDLSEIT
jgi:hypothetical protein